jgi:hypothetical protein
MSIGVAIAPSIARLLYHRLWEKSIGNVAQKIGAKIVETVYYSESCSPRNVGEQPKVM